MKWISKTTPEWISGLGPKRSATTKTFTVGEKLTLFQTHHLRCVQSAIVFLHPESRQTEQGEPVTWTKQSRYNKESAFSRLSISYFCRQIQINVFFVLFFLATVFFGFRCRPAYYSGLGKEGNKYLIPHCRVSSDFPAPNSLMFPWFSRFDFHFFPWLYRLFSTEHVNNTYDNSYRLHKIIYCLFKLVTLSSF